MFKMKAIYALGLILLLASVFSCDDDLSVPAITGLTLYWDHEIFGDEGRRFRFEVTTTNGFGTDYELEFSKSIEDKSITVRLVNSIDNGRCPYFPSPGVTAGLQTCTASGSFYLSDEELDNGVYSLTIILPNFDVTSELTVTDELATLDVPDNNFLSSSTENVYPIPPDLVYGSIVYQDSSNANDAEDFLDHLTGLGLIQTTVPDYRYRHMDVDENGYPPEQHWDPDRHLIGFLYQMNSVEFKTIFEASKDYFFQSNLDLYIYSSNGDQGRMSKSEGITVVYAK